MKTLKEKYSNRLSKGRKVTIQLIEFNPHSHLITKGGKVLKSFSKNKAKAVEAFENMK